mmetsp:Transcript_32459/g.68276  ORF Transcript_32459/g.68276 Transcript_32459/m.68276 type:complete len:216 (-) Transcript_32459:1081-1728(-)
MHVCRLTRAHVHVRVLRLRKRVALCALARGHTLRCAWLRASGYRGCVCAQACVCACACLHARGGEYERDEGERAERSEDELEPAALEQHRGEARAQQRGGAKRREEEGVDRGARRTVHAHRLRREHGEVATHTEEHHDGGHREGGARGGELLEEHHGDGLDDREDHERRLEAEYVSKRAPCEPARRVAQNGREGAHEREEGVRVQVRLLGAKRLV